MAIQYERQPTRKSKKPKQDTPGVGHNAAPALDAEQVKSFFDRWTNLENEKQATSDDLKDLFAEAKGLRFNAKAMRAAFRHRRRLDQGKTPSREEQAELDLYLAALDALSDFVTKPSHAREAAPETQAKAGVETEAGPQGQTAAGSVSRPAAGRTVAANVSEGVTAGETAPHPKPVMPDIPEGLRRQQTDHAA